MKTEEDYIKKYGNAERRMTFHPVSVEQRAEGDNEEAMIRGIAAVVNSRTDLGWFYEEILPGAFDEVLSDDVRALFNHSPDMVLARTTSGTLKIFLDGDGHLNYEYKTPDRSYAKDLEDAIRSGDVSQSSFAFTVKEARCIENIDEEKELRQIVKVEKLYDVSPVTFSAYEDTTVAERSFNAVKQEKEKKEEDEKRSNQSNNYKYKNQLLKVKLK